MSIEMDNLLLSESTEDDDKEEMATLEQFERCMDACGFGKYQWWMLSISFLGVLAHVSVMVSTPYAFSLGTANKYNKDIKTLLFLVPYLGILISSIISGFLSDCFGRRKVIIICYAGLAVSALLEGAIRHYRYVVFGKFCEGFFLSGAFVASTTLQAEFQTEKSRDRIMVTLNFFVSISHIIIALAGLPIPDLAWNTVNIGDLLEVDLWDICIVFNVIFCLAACLLYAWIPESPKSDFVHGRYNSALETVKRVYAMNTGKSSDEFPYQLLGMIDNEPKSYGEQVRSTWAKVILIFEQPLLKFLIIIMAAQIIFTFSYNSMILWHRTVVFAVERTKYLYLTADSCAELDEEDRIIKIDTLRVVLHHIQNSVFMFMFGLIPYAVVTLFINIGKKLILIISLCVCCCSIISMHWINSNSGSILMLGGFMAIGQICIGIIQAIVVELFPVYTKSLALSLVLTASAVGAVLAEVLFSYSEQFDCASYGLVWLFTSIGSTSIACAALISLFLPK